MDIIPKLILHISEANSSTRNLTIPVILDAKRRGSHKFTKLHQILGSFKPRMTRVIKIPYRRIGVSNFEFLFFIYLEDLIESVDINLSTASGCATGLGEAADSVVAGGTY